MDKAYNLYMQGDSHINTNIKVHTFNTQEAEAEDHKFWISLSYRVSSCLKNPLFPLQAHTYTCVCVYVLMKRLFP